jgi:hypothetical protein
MADETPKKGGRATITADDTVKFLISCIKFVTGSKVSCVLNSLRIDV